MNRRILCLIALLLTAALLLCRPPATDQTHLPGAAAPARTVINIWTLSSIGGGQAWLKQALKRYERAHPGVMTYLRQARAADLADPNAVLPDLLLYMPGDLSSPDRLTPITGALPIPDALLACGRCGASQYAVPLCWGAYVLAVSSHLEPGSAATPQPTTLLGKPAPTEESPQASATPGYPLQAAQADAEPLQCAEGVPQLVLRMLLPDALPPLPDTALDQSQIYARYLAGSCASAMLTTGQATALASAIMAGKAPATRILAPQTIVTDQVWLASLPQGAHAEAAALLAWLVSNDAQQLLAAQQLQPAREATRLYATDWPAEIANAAQRRLIAVHAYLPADQLRQTCRQALQGQLTAADAQLQICMDNSADTR